MTVLTGTATDHNDLLADLRAFLVSGGPGWTELSYSGGISLLRAPGLSGTEEIHLGLSLVSDFGNDAYALTAWMFQDYNSGLPPQGQPGHSGVKYHPIWNTAMDYRFIANGQCLKVITKVSTVYTASYFGAYLRYGTPGEYPQPYYLGMPRNSNTRWSNTSEDYRNFFDPGEGSRLLTPSGSWINVQNYSQSSGEVNGAGPGFIFPFFANIAGNSVTKDRYRALRENIDGSYDLTPLVLCSNSPTNDVFGELDGVYAIPAFSAASEDIVEIGSDDYLVVQNVYRTSRHYYAAFKLT